MAILVLFYSSPSWSQTCEELRAQVQVDCHRNQLDEVVIEQRFQTARNQVDVNEQGVVTSTETAQSAVLQATVDFQTYSAQCISKVAQCSTTCGQTIPSGPLPATFTYVCMEGTAADHYNDVQDVGRNMCNVINEQDILMEGVTGSTISTYCAQFTNQNVSVALPPATPAVPATTASTAATSATPAAATSPTTDGSVPASASSLSTELANSSSGDGELIETASSNLREPASWTGFAVRYGDSNIGVANADIFLQMDQRAQQLMSEVEN